MENNYQSQSQPTVKKSHTLTPPTGSIASMITPLSQDAAAKGSLTNLAVFLRGVTWVRDSHGLFDYESKSITKKSLKTQSFGKIVRISNDIELIPLAKRDNEIGAEAQTLLQIRGDQNNYYLDHSENCELDEDSVDRLWLVIRSLKTQEGKYDYKIKKFDVIKLGRVKFRVKDFACEQMGQSPEELYEQELKEARHVTKLDHSSPEQSQCRFCWGNESCEENPCIVPCKCTGSVGFIHYHCLKNWLSSKMQKKESEHLMSMYWKTFECEICKYAYPYLFKVDKKVYKLVDIQKPKSGHFIVMESLPLEKNTSRTIHVLNFSAEKSQFNMGRGHESEVRVNDISVSRCHAILKYQPDGIYIEDNRSKFGTLVLLKDTYPLQLEYTSAVQVGRTVVSFTVRNTSIDKQFVHDGVQNFAKVVDGKEGLPQQIFQVQKLGHQAQRQGSIQPAQPVDTTNNNNSNNGMDIDG